MATKITDLNSVNTISNMPENLGTYKVGHSNNNSFNRFKNFENTDLDLSGYGYIFFTCPDMNMDNSFPNSFYNSNEMSEIRDLFRGKGFMFPLTNYSQNFELTDTVLRTDTYTQTVKGYKMIVGKDTVDSVTEGTFNISYTEPQDLAILKTHMFWVDYINDVRFGSIKCNPNARSTRTKTGFLDYVSSVYYFKLAPDGFTITYYAKYTGVFPTNVPHSSQNWQKGEVRVTNPSYTYSYSFKHEMQPWILEDFNYSSRLRNPSPNFATNDIHMTKNWVKNAGVVKYLNSKGHYTYALRME